MTKKKKSQQEQGTKDKSISIDESSDLDKVHIMEEDSASVDEGCTEDGNEVELLRKQLEKSRDEAEENQQQFLRARADLENYRRRARKELEDMRKYASVPLVESLLPVLDNFERALEAADKTKENTLYEGVEMVYRQLQSALEGAGLVRIESMGEPFDPHQHNAVMQEESADSQSGIVLDELQAGYRFEDRVIRPSMVKICK